MKNLKLEEFLVTVLKQNVKQEIILLQFSTLYFVVGEIKPGVVICLIDQLEQCIILNSCTKWN